MNRPYSPTKAAAVEAVTEAKLAAETAPRRRREPIKPYKADSYTPERIVMSLSAIALIVLFAAVLVQQRQLNNVPEVLMEPAPIPTGFEGV